MLIYAILSPLIFSMGFLLGASWAARERDPSDYAGDEHADFLGFDPGRVGD